MKIAIVKLSAMGDIVHAMVVLQYIKKQIPKCQIDWIVEEIFVDVLKYNPHIDNILPINLKSIKKDKKQLFSQITLVKKYAQNNYDLVIDAQGLVKSAIVSKILGKNCGFDKNSIREKIASYFYKKSFFIPYEENVIKRNYFLVMKSLKLNENILDLSTKESFLFFRKEDKEITLPFLSVKEKNIVYILGSSWKSKVYPKEKFVEIINKLDGNHLLVWGSDEEKKSAEYIARQCNAKMLPKMTLNELKALISSANLVIGGDSGPTHMAWALNRPSITIFGPTPSYRNTLTTSINRVLDCGNKVDPKDLDKSDYCIREIQVEKILKIAKGLL
jgi:heptosyltransferase-1